MKKMVFILTLLFMLSVSVSAGTVAYWRFEAGPAGTNVVHGAADGIYAADISDVSGNGNHLSVWTSADYAGYRYSDDVAYSTVPLTGAANTLSVKNAGGVPGMFTQTGSGISTMAPAQWTVEVTCKLEHGWYKTIIGRDSMGTATVNGDLAALYLVVIPDQALSIKFCDVSGYWHEANSAANAIQGFDFGSDPDGTNAPWYSIAAVSDSSLLSLYLLEHGSGQGYQLIAQTDLTASGSPDTALTAGAGDGGDWDAGNWTVGRGMYAGGHGDRAYGFIDEVRISDSALTPTELLFSEDYRDTVAYWRFEEGSVDSPVDHNGLPDGVFYPGVIDVTGKGNHLSAWSEVLGGYIYRDEVPTLSVPQTGADNSLCVQNSDSFPSLFTSSTDGNPFGHDLETWQPDTFTIEASFKPESGGHRTIIGRDGQNVVTGNGALAALYFQLQPDDSIAIKFADVSGYWHEAISDPGLIKYDGAGHWYHMAAVCDPNSLKLYLNDIDAGLGYQLVAEIDMTLSGSPDARLVADTSNGSDWHGGGWSIGRGLFNGEHTDRLIGYVDEVRISSAAFEPYQFLFYEPSYAGIIVTPLNLVIHEENTTNGDLFLSLENPPNGDVTLMIQELNQRGQVSLDTTTLVFTTGNWDMPQSVTITAVDDTDLENAEHQVPLSITVTSVQDSEYEGLSVDPVIVTVADNECGAWGYALSDFNMDCTVDLHDFAKFLQDWLDCSEPNQTDCTNFGVN